MIAQPADAHAVHVIELSGHVAPARPIRHGGKTGLRNLFQQIEIDLVVDAPCVQELLSELNEC